MKFFVSCHLLLWNPYHFYSCLRFASVEGFLFPLARFYYYLTGLLKCHGKVIYPHYAASLHKYKCCLNKFNHSVCCLLHACQNVHTGRVHMIYLHDTQCKYWQNQWMLIKHSSSFMQMIVKIRSLLVFIFSNRDKRDCWIHREKLCAKPYILFMWLR